VSATSAGRVGWIRHRRVIFSCGCLLTAGGSRFKMAFSVQNPRRDVGIARPRAARSPCSLTPPSYSKSSARRQTPFKKPERRGESALEGKRVIGVDRLRPGLLRQPCGRRSRRASSRRRGPPRRTEARSPGQPGMPMPYQIRPGSRVVTSWTSHALPSGSLKEKNDP
jgi:hypothetical protein